MKRQNILSLAVALALIPLTGQSVTSVTAVTTDVSPPPPPTQPQATLPSMDFTKQLSWQAQEVTRLVSSGVPNDVVKAYINNVPAPFNLSSDGIIHLQQLGISGPLITEMLNHDTNLRQMASAYLPPGAIPGNQLPPTQYPADLSNTQTQPAYTVADTGDQAAPPDADTYNQLSPYGDWNNVPGYGWGWQPSSWGGWGGWPWPTLGWGFWWGVPGFGWCWFPHNNFNNFHNHFHNNNFHNHNDFHNHNNNFHGNNFAGHSGQNGFVAHSSNGHTVVAHSSNGHTFVAHSSSGFHGNNVTVHSFGGMSHSGGMGSFHGSGMGGMHGGGMGGMHGGGGGGGHGGGGGGGHR